MQFAGGKHWKEPAQFSKNRLVRIMRKFVAKSFLGAKFYYYGYFGIVNRYLDSFYASRLVSRNAPKLLNIILQN